MEHKGKIGFWEKLGYGTASLSHDLSSQFISTFLLFYLTDVLGITPAVAGTIWMLANIWDGVNDPLIGFYADNHRFKNGEKLRPFAIWFGLPYGILLTLLFTAFEIPLWGKAAYVLIIFILMDSVSTCFRLPFYTMYILATDDPRQRVSLKTFATAGSALGVLLGSVRCYPMVYLFGGRGADGTIIDPKRGFFFAALVFAVISVAGPMYNALTTRERVMPEGNKDSKISVIQAIKLLLGYKNWRLNTIYVLLYSIGNLMTTTVLVYYANHILHDAGTVGIIFAVFVVGSLAALPFVGKLSKILGKKRMLFWSGVIYILCRIPFLVDPYALTMMLVNVFFMGFAMSTSQVGFYAILADCVDVVEWKHGKRIEGMSASVTALVVKCANAVVAFAAGIALELTHYDETLTVQPIAAQNVINTFIGIGPMAAAAVLAIVASRYTIEEDVAEMQLAKTMEKD